MKILIQESGTVDLFTIQELLRNADRQANFHPDSRWILSSKLGIQKNTLPNKETRSVINLEVKWIGRESVTMWLISNQIKFQVLSYSLLKEEKEALDTAYDDLAFSEDSSKLN